MIFFLQNIKRYALYLLFENEEEEKICRFIQFSIFIKFISLKYIFLCDLFNKTSFASCTITFFQIEMNSFLPTEFLN